MDALKEGPTRPGEDPPADSSPPPPPPASPHPNPSLAARARAALLAARRAVTLSECSGALGDLGTFLPLTLGLVQAVGLDFGTTLLFTGLYNVYSGLATGVPMCVQPMKTIAAVAIASNGGVTLVQVMAAGIFVSSAVLFLGVTRLVDVLHRVVPRSIIRGLQLGVGLKLAGSGLKMALTLKPAAAAAAAATAASTSKAAAAASSAVAALRWRQPLGVDGLLLGVLGLAFLLVTTIARRGPEEPTDVDGPLRLPVWLRRRRRGRPSLGGSGASSSSGEGDWPCRAPSDEQEEQEDRTAATTTTTAPTTQPQTCRVPSALLVVLVGVALTLATSPAGTLSALRLGPSRPQLTVPSPQDMVAGITTAGGLAQLPLTTLNSVLAVTQLADALYGADRPHDRWRWKPSLVAASVGVMNLLGCFFGAMPSCHGSGGLAAQHLFGARTGAAPVLLGGLKIALALLFGSSLFGLLRRFPEPLLGALLALSGVELASAARREAGPRGFSLLALTAAAILALDDTALGFAVGYGGWLVVIAYEFAAERLGVAVARARVLVAKRRAAAREESAAEP